MAASGAHTQGQGTAAVRVPLFAPRSHPLHLPASRRRTRIDARTPEAPRRRARLRNRATRRRQSAAARADERSRGTPRHPGRRMVPRSAKRRTRRIAERRPGRASRQGVDNRRRDSGLQCIACRCGRRRRSYAILDVSPVRLRYLNELLNGQAVTLMSNRATLEEELRAADLVVGTVLVPGARTPRLITARLVATMKRGAALVDLSIDQGGISETSRPTTHARPIYIREGVVHYCVTNMPGVVPHTSTYALTNATVPYALDIADHGLLEAGERNRALRHGLNTWDGKVCHPAVAESVKLKPHSPWD